MLQFAEYSRKSPLLVAQANPERLPAPAYMLACHSIEQSLKGYLPRRGMPVDELSSPTFGHGLWPHLNKSLQRRIDRLVRIVEWDHQDFESIAPI